MKSLLDPDSLNLEDNSDSTFADGELFSERPTVLDGLFGGVRLNNPSTCFFFAAGVALELLMEFTA